MLMYIFGGILGFALGEAVRFLVMGKGAYEHSDKRKFVNWQSALLGICNIFFVLAAILLFSGMAKGDLIFCAIVVIAYPVALIVCAIHCRKKEKLRRQEQERLEKDYNERHKREY